MARVRWESLEPDARAQLRRLVGPGDSTDVAMGIPKKVRIANVEGLRAPLARGAEGEGYVLAFQTAALALQVRVEVPPEHLGALQGDVELLARSFGQV